MQTHIQKHAHISRTRKFILVPRCFTYIDFKNFNPDRANSMKNSCNL